MLSKFILENTRVARVVTQLRLVLQQVAFLSELSSDPIDAAVLHLEIFILGLDPSLRLKSPWRDPLYTLTLQVLSSTNRSNDFLF
jgi:hypothetical protein